MDAAIGKYHEALRIEPNYSKMHISLGVALAGKGGLDSAIKEYQEALRLDHKPHVAAAAGQSPK